MTELSTLHVGTARRLIYWLRCYSNAQIG